MSAAAVLFSVNAYQRVASFFHLVNIQWTSKTKQVTMKFKKKKKLVGIVNRNYAHHSNKILNAMKRRGNCCLSGSGRCDIPGHNSKYLTYSFMDKRKKLVKLQLCL